MKKISVIIVMMVMMLAGCERRTDTPFTAQESSSKAVTADGSDSSEEEKDAAQLPETGTFEDEAETAASSENGFDGAAEGTTTASKTAEGEKREESRTGDEESGKKENAMRLLIGETEVPVAWEDNSSVKELKGLCPLTIQMSMYCGFEQVGPIGQNIAREDEQTVTDSGDIVLYSGNQIVIFYGSNSWVYTRLGHIDLTEQEMRDLLSRGDVTITLQ
jgi:hypothetical protein